MEISRVTQMRKRLSAPHPTIQKIIEKQAQKWLKIGLFYTDSSLNQEYLNRYTNQENAGGEEHR